MKTIRPTLIVLLTFVSVPAGLSQPFSAGSNGSYGPINITTNTTLDIPLDGIFHATTISVAANRILTFRKNAMNTPVYLLASGDVTITGVIDLQGRNGNNVVGGESGPGGFNGGNPGSVSVPPGAGHGPGAGKGGVGSRTVDGAGPGAYATVVNVTSTNRGAVYGSALLVPIVGGSGGGGTAGTPGAGGGGGGGAVLIASNTRIDVTGLIDVDGATSSANTDNGASGGAIRLVAPVVAGTATLSANGSGGGGSGRIRVDTLNRTTMSFSFSPVATTSIGSMMLVFPTPLPRLDIIEAAGTPIPVGSGPVIVQLPFGSSTARTVKVQARDFNDLVPISVVLTPDNGTPTIYQTSIDNRTINPAEVTLNVVVPVNVQTAVNAWTR